MTHRPHNPDPRVTVIPPTNEALAAVTTPFVAFEHRFRDQPARYERQANFLDNHWELDCGFTIGDVWPDCTRVPLRRRHFIAAVRSLVASNVIGRPLWPETALYRMDFLEQYNVKIDERVRYRPAAHFFCSVYEKAGKRFEEALAPHAEAIIEVPKRSQYPYETFAPDIPMKEVQCKVSVLMVLDGHALSVEESIRSVLAQTFTDFELLIINLDDAAAFAVASGIEDERIRLYSMSDGHTRAEGLNLGLEYATGEYICIQDAASVAHYDRLERQLATGASFVGGVCPPSIESYTDLHEKTRDVHVEGCTRLLNSYARPGIQECLPLATHLFHRDHVLQSGGYDPVLSVRHGHEFQLRVLADLKSPFAKLRSPIISWDRPGTRTPDAEAGYGNCYHTLVGRDIGQYYAAIRGRRWAWRNQYYGQEAQQKA